MDRTPGPSPTTTRPPRLARRILSRPSRKGRPGATMARASLSGELWRAVTGEWYLSPTRSAPWSVGASASKCRPVPGPVPGPVTRETVGSEVGSEAGGAPEAGDRLGHRVHPDQLDLCLLYT